MASDLSNDFVISDMNYDSPQVMGGVVADGSTFRRGLIPRDFSAFHRGCYGSAQAIDIPLIARDQWSSIIKTQEAEKSRLSDIRMTGANGKMIPSLDQNGQGFCWSYSTTGCVQILRAVSNQPYVALSAHSVACVIKNFRDEGGWGALSLDFITTRGIVPQDLWPAKSMSRSHDTAANWKEALKYRTTDAWIDLADPVYYRNLSFDQVGTLLLSRVPVVLDYNWWGHSVFGLDLVEVDSRYPVTDIRRWGIRILNSWTDAWGVNGTSVLVGSKAVSNGAVAPKTVAFAA